MEATKILKPMGKSRKSKKAFLEAESPIFFVAFFFPYHPNWILHGKNQHPWALDIKARDRKEDLVGYLSFSLFWKPPTAHLRFINKSHYGYSKYQ